jgi:hypothetical protein
MEKKIVFILVLLFSVSVFGCAGTEKQIEENSVSIDLIKGRTNDINEELNGVSSRLNTVYAQVTELDARLEGLAELKEETETLIANMDFSMPGPTVLRIKVLSGDGDIKSAKALEKRLKKEGYGIERVDMAPYDTFSRHTVFYAEGRKNDAETMARVLGGKTITKPLTWFSIFDIIAVSGKK